jgi:hypothetical protein
MRMRVSTHACPDAKTMRRCTLSCVSWQREQSLIRVADRGRCSPITCAPTHAHCARTQHTHADTHPHVTRNPSIHAHHATEEHGHTTRKQVGLQLITRCTSALSSYYLWYYGGMIIYDWPRAGPHALIFCGRAPYARVKHAAGNHSSSAGSSRRQQHRPVFLNTNLNAKRKGRTCDVAYQ